MHDGQENCRASQARCHCMICCAFYHIRKTQFETTLLSRLYITYRAILNIWLYNWRLQKELLKLLFCIIVYLYRDIHCKAIVQVKNCTLYPYTFIHAITLYRYIWYNHICQYPLQVCTNDTSIRLYSVYPYTHYNAIRRVTLYSVSANTGYTPIRRGCVYAHKLILFHGV